MPIVQSIMLRILQSLDAQYVVRVDMRRGGQSIYGYGTVVVLPAAQSGREYDLWGTTIFPLEIEELVVECTSPVPQALVITFDGKTQVAEIPYGITVIDLGKLEAEPSRFPWLIVVGAVVMGLLLVGRRR